MVKKQIIEFRLSQLKKTGKCPCCDDPASSKNERRSCRNAGCPVLPKKTGRKTKTDTHKKKLKKERDKRHYLEVKKPKKRANVKEKVNRLYPGIPLEKTKEVDEAIYKMEGGCNTIGYGHPLWDEFKRHLAIFKPDHEGEAMDYYE